MSYRVTLLIAERRVVSVAAGAFTNSLELFPAGRVPVAHRCLPRFSHHTEALRNQKGD